MRSLQAFPVQIDAEKADWAGATPLQQVPFLRKLASTPRSICQAGVKQWGSVSQEPRETGFNL